MTDVRKVPRQRFHVGRTRVVMAVAALVVCAVLYGWHHAATRNAAAESGAGTAIPVETALAARANVPVYLQGLGAVQAFYTVKITPRVDGQLQTVGFVEGQRVAKNDVLAQIDPRLYQASLEQALAARAKDASQLANAERDLKRYQTLAPQNLTSQQTLNAQQALVAQDNAQIKADQAAIDSARTELSYTTIRSPIRGVTGIRMVDPGNIVHATDTAPIVVITQVQPISVIFSLPEDELDEVHGAMAKGPVSVVALPRDASAGGKAVLDRGRIDLIDNQIDQATGTISLKATFPNPHETLWPGEFVNARTLLKTEHDVLTIPSAALQHGPDGAFTYVVQPDHTVKVQAIGVGGESGDSVVVTSGLQAGARVVTSNQFRLQPGALVQTIQDPPAVASPVAVANDSP